LCSCTTRKEAFELPKISRLGKAIRHINTIICEPLSPASIWKSIGINSNPKSGTIHEITSISISLFPNRFAQTPYSCTKCVFAIEPVLAGCFWKERESERRMHALAKIL
jgi:hypothetical protein